LCIQPLCIQPLCIQPQIVAAKPRSARKLGPLNGRTSSSAYTILLANIAPVTSTTANIPVAILLVIHLFCLLLSMPFGFLPVHIVQAFGLDQLVHLHR